MSPTEILERPAGGGWLALLGGGEFSFGETAEADRAWVVRAAEGTLGFLPAASGSADYGKELAQYFAEVYGRELVTLPIYRERDAKRGRNLERIAECAAVYIGGGLSDQLLEVLAGSPAASVLLECLAAGSVVVAIGAAAQALGIVTGGLGSRAILPGLGWLPGGVVEANFDPAHDRRLRRLLDVPGVRWGLGLPAGSAVLLGPDGAVEVIGTVFLVTGRDGDLEVLEG